MSGSLQKYKNAPALHIRNYAQQDIKSCWYGHDEDKQTIMEYLSDSSTYDIELISSGSLPVTFRQPHCHRSSQNMKQRSSSCDNSKILCLHPFVALQSKADRKLLEYKRDYIYHKARHSLLKTQQRQIQQDLKDPDRLAKVYSRNAEESRRIARWIAQGVQKEVQHPIKNGPLCEFSSKWNKLR